MSLRDELASALGGRARKVITDPTRLTPLFEWALADAAAPIIEAERAATIEQVAALLDTGSADSLVDERDCRILLAKIVRGLAHDRSALDEMLAQARAEGTDDILAALGDAVEELLPGVGLKWDVAQNHDSARAWLKRAVDQACQGQK